MPIDPKTIAKAKSRLRVAEKAISELGEARSHTAFSDIWYTFLVAAKNVYTSLEQGCKPNAQDAQWFGAKKSFRKNDKLLQYLFQARDDDEHGIESVTELDPGGVAFGVNKPGFSQNVSGSFIFRNGQVTVLNLQSNDEKPILVEKISPHTKLRTVTGRGPIRYDPPTSHLGVDLPDNLPITVANLALTYLKHLVSEAESRG